MVVVKLRAHHTTVYNRKLSVSFVAWPSGSKISCIWMFTFSLPFLSYKTRYFGRSGIGEWLPVKLESRPERMAERTQLRLVSLPTSLGLHSHRRMSFRWEGGRRASGERKAMALQCWARASSVRYSQTQKEQPFNSKQSPGGTGHGTFCATAN